MDCRGEAISRGEATSRKSKLQEARPSRFTTAPLASGTKKVLEFNYTSLTEASCDPTTWMNLENVLSTINQIQKYKYAIISLI